MMERLRLIGYLLPPACTGKERPHSNFILLSLIEDKTIYRAKTGQTNLSMMFKLNANTTINQTHDDIELLINEIHETVIIEQAE